MPADCSTCWRDPAPPPAGTHARGQAWQLDWVLPTAERDAAMAEAALPEGAERLARRPGAALKTDTAQMTHTPTEAAATAGSAGSLPSTRAARGAAQPLQLRRATGLKVAAGPAWMGYLGLELHVPRTSPGWPAGATAWTALVEQVPAGSAGNTDTRWLVRAVAGPWPVPQAGPARGAPGRAALIHRWAMRWPSAARVERLQARAWVEGPQGQLLAVAAEGCPR